MKSKYIIYFLSVLNETAKLSTCQSKQVSALLVKDSRILSIGYNGVPANAKHCSEYAFETPEEHSNWSKDNELHAEMNCIAFAAKEGISTKNTILFTKYSPCSNCSKLILAASIKTVYYDIEYTNDLNGIKFLKAHNVKVHKLDKFINK